MKTYQPFLFAELQSQEPETNNGIKFQVLNYTDPSNKFTVVVQENEDPEKVALQRLGFFVVPEAA